MNKTKYNRHFNNKQDRSLKTCEKLIKVINKVKIRNFKFFISLLYMQKSENKTFEQAKIAGKQKL